MSRRSARHLTFANAVSVIALTLALGSGAYALALEANSVGTTQLKDGAVTKPKLHDNAVVSSKVKRASLRGSDIKLSTLPFEPRFTKFGRRINQGTTTTLATTGPFSLVGRCLPPTDYPEGQVRIKTTSTGSDYASQQSASDVTNMVAGDFYPIVTAFAPDNIFKSPVNFAAQSPTGKWVIMGQAGASVLNSGTCIFEGWVKVLRRP